MDAAAARDVGELTWFIGQDRTIVLLKAVRTRREARLFEQREVADGLERPHEAKL